MLSFLLTFYPMSDDGSSEEDDYFNGFINKLIEEEGNRYLQMVQSNIFFLVMVFYAFKMKLMQYRFTSDNYVKARNHLKCMAGLFFTFQVLLSAGIFVTKILIDIDHVYDPKQLKSQIYM